MKNSLYLSFLLLLVLVAPALALPSTVIVSGAGLTAVNGTYTISSTTFNSVNYYTATGSYVIYWDGIHWDFCSQLGGGNGTATPLQSNGGQTATSGPPGTYIQGPSGYYPPAPTVVAGAAPATLTSLTASPTSLTASGTVTLTATLTAAAPTGGAQVTITEASVNWSGNVGFSTYLTIPAGSTSASEPVTLNYQGGSGTDTYTATYNGVSKSAAITVGPAASTSPPTGSISITPFSGTASSSPTLSWSTSGATSVTVTGQTSPPTSGSATVNPTATTTYTLVATNSYGSNTYTCTWTLSSGSGGSSGGGVGTVGGTTNPLAPGVSASLTPYNIASGGSSVLRCDTSGATTVNVSGVTQPSATGSVNVSPTATTSYTVTATNSYGTTYQTVTLVVGGSGAGGDGTSTFTPGTTVNNGGSSTTTYTLGGVNIPGATIPGVTLPGLPTIPPITLPGVNLPTITLPGVTFPGANSPGDLKIGIPGLGSIGIPSGWLTQLIAAAINPASIAQQVATYTVGNFNALATYNAGAAVTNAVNQGTATLQQINNVTSEQEQAAINNTTAAVNAGLSATQSTINTTATATQNTINTAETRSVVDFKGMLSDLLQYLFIPDPSVLNQFETERASFLDWGPYHFVTSFQASIDAPAGDGSLNGTLPGLAFPEVAVNADPDNYTIVTNQTGTINSYSQQVQSVSPNDAATSTSVVAPGTWYATGRYIPVDFSQVTANSLWPYVRDFEGGIIYILFVGGCLLRFFPKQVL